jgi:hypothetical protein
MGRATYLIAKYVPDLFRNEPINVGIILWIDGVVGARFVAETNGKLDLRQAPTQIVSRSAYRQWVSTWRDLIESDFGKIIGTSKVIAKSDPAFLETLKSTSQGNYVLESGGQLLDSVSEKDFSDVLDYLFDRLVEDRTDEIQNQNAKEIRNDLLRAGNLNADPRVITDKMVPCKIGQKEVHHEFHLYIGNGAPLALGQVIPMTDHARSVKKTAESFAYRFETAKNSYQAESPKCLALIFNPDNRNEKPLHDAIAELEEIATVIDITSDRKPALAEISRFAAMVKINHS